MTTAIDYKRQAEQILTRRAAEKVLARRHLVPFCKYTKFDYLEASHLNLLAEKLEAVERGEITRLIVTMPPQHGKSEKVSVRFPVYCLGKKPDRRIVQASYADSLALFHSRQARDVFVSPEFRELFPDAGYRPLDKKEKGIEPSRAAHEWETSMGGSYYAVGVGGGLTGRGFDIGVIDDPVKDYASAKSQVIRDSIYNWYTTVFRTRCRPGAAIIILMTRWHEVDLVGRLLKDAEEKPDADQWDVMNLPAINDRGEALWPGRYDIDYLNTTKRTIGSFSFASLYQGSPMAEGGNMFKREWFEVVQASPAQGTRVRFWDMAATEPKPGTDPDYTVGGKMSESPEHVYYVEDVRRDRLSSFNTEKLVLQTAVIDGKRVKIRMEQEPGSAGKTVINNYTRKLVGYNFKGVPATGSKEVRAIPAAAQAEAGNIKLVAGPWVADFLDEVELFPNGAHDDQVDFLSGAFEELTTVGRPMRIG